jgi:chromate transporter
MDLAMKLGDSLLTLAGFFALMSLFAIGGANSAVPEMHRYAVEVQRWLTDQQFSDSFALAQLTPGPNVILVTLIGYHVAGLPGALVTTLAMCGPACLFAFFVGRTFDRFRGAAWHVRLSGALVPVTLGLTAASAAVIATAADHTAMAIVITLAAAAVTYWMRINPIWVFAAAALVGLSGVV